ncbi:cytochrome c556 [Sphingomonas kaistensis]|uniref:Cytochrome c556 n=1 Tax=Sphingomonas kaistensis TaxID=298708 RepID=A0A7X5Y7V8_9SPHN|nr:cytochrome c [Sphingomonas kaistensis]NJC06754.1 cytochrome c556 [Sphingomonas kaistensis]
MRILILSSVAAAVLGTAAIAAPLSREAGVRMIAQRHAGYEQLGKAMRAAKQSIGKGDVAATRASANQIAALAARAPNWFPVGSGPEAGKTHAKALVWQQRADFDAKMKNLGSAARLFQSAAASGDLAAIKAAHGKLGQTCGACHDQYREEH